MANDTNCGPGMVYDTPDEKEIARLEARVKSLVIERYAMRRRAESAESDWRAVERERDALFAVIESYHRGRCYACGWTLAPNADKGCVPGNCCFRPDVHSSEYKSWHPRAVQLRAIDAAIAARGAP